MVLTVEVVVVTINVYVHRIGVVRLVRYSANLLPSTARMMMVLFVEERGDVNVTDVCAITVMPVSGHSLYFLLGFFTPPPPLLYKIPVFVKLHR